ncbi:MAG: dipeptide epimerase, partial [Verrucomicrobia bacterium]
MSVTHSRVRLEVRNENLPLKAPFRISGYTFHDSPVTLVTLRDGGVEGRGEAAGVYYLNDTTDRMLATIEAHRDAIECGLTREELRSLLPPGGARNALDCALWELESRRTQTPVW